MTRNTIRHFWSKTSSLSHTNRNSALNCGAKPSNLRSKKVPKLSHTSKLQIAGVKSNFAGSKNEVWVKISNLCGQKFKTVRIGAKSHFTASKNEAWVKCQICVVKSSKLSHSGGPQFASDQNLRFANDQICRVKKRQKMRSPGIEPGSITWQATIITTRPRAQLRT